MVLIDYYQASWVVDALLVTPAEFHHLRHAEARREKPLSNYTADGIVQGAVRVQVGSDLHPHGTVLVAV